MLSSDNYRRFKRFRCILYFHFWGFDMLSLSLLYLVNGKRSAYEIYHSKLTLVKKWGTCHFAKLWFRVFSLKFII